MMLWAVMLVAVLEKATVPLEQKSAGYSHCTLRRGGERGNALVQQHLNCSG